MQAFHKLLPVAISFNGVTSVRESDKTNYFVGDVLFRFSVRLIHIWLSTTVELDDVVDTIMDNIRSGTLKKHVSLRSVIQLIASRSGKLLSS